MNSGDQNKQGKNRKTIFKKLGKRGLGGIISIALALIASLIWFLILPLLQQPMSPSVTSVPSSNPVVNTGDSLSFPVTAIPDFKPPYINNIVLTIENPNPYKCYMVLELKASDGFKFLPVSENLPDNFRAEEGYEYQDIMKVYITDFPPRFSYNLTLSVYTLNPDTYGGTENISTKDLEVQQEQ